MIKIAFDPKSLRFVMNGPFNTLDVLRAFPSRRFDPKTKTWRAPLTRQNIEYLKSLHCVELADSAKEALRDFQKLTAGPVYVPFPEGHSFALPPFPHQMDMLNKAWGLKAFAIFAEMGTGKTFTTVNLAMARYDAGLIDRLVIICPETLRRTWLREFNKYARPGSFDFREHRSDDTKLWEWAADRDKRLKILAVSVEGLGISEKLFERLMDFFSPGHRTMAVVDESSRIKNPKAKRTERVVQVGSWVEYKLILNGTPIAKGIQDLYSQFEFLDPNIIGSGDYWSFKTRYLVMGGYEGREILGYANVDELMNSIRPYSIDVRKALLNLPDKVYKQIYVEATPQQRTLFKAINTGLAAAEEQRISVQNVLERMLRCQQVIGGFRPITDPETGITRTEALSENPKMKALIDFIEANKEGTKFIIWARYLPELRLIVDTLSAAYGPESVLTYYGETTKELRAEAESRYGSDPKARFLVGNPAAAGLGLTLISGENDVMIYYSGTFAYIDRAQSEDRAHRIGQRNNVAVVDLIMEDTLDETIQAAIAAKKDMDTFVKDEVSKGVPIQALLRI